ncbi:MAG TPA: PIG-L deacetylase family protein [Pyrinomonadaceae bacterium]|nr:PIG-L deacetylase family protein [Pyrinomonadaceae bacterium]
MVSEIKRVLAVGAHPDDVEIISTGTLFSLHQLGHEVHVASLTLGDCGSVELSAEEIRRIRHREAMKACEVINATYHHAGFDDLCIFNDDNSNRFVTSLLREVDPGIVITHSPNDYISDHEMTSLLDRNACFYASIPNYKTKASAAVSTLNIAYLYYAPPMEGIDIFGKKVTPQFYVDISGVMQQKLEMLACHESQRNWLRAHHGIDEYIESVRRFNTSLGQRASELSGRVITYAEAFRQHRGHAYPNDNVIMTFLRESVIAEPAYLVADAND